VLPDFADGRRLLAEAEVRGLGGIVSKRRDERYFSGQGGWVKVKTRCWREANRERWRAFVRDSR
jgi:ATP-dependent DNA ligase